MGNRIAKHIYSATGVFEKSTYYVRDASGNTMSTYESKQEPIGEWSYMLIERHIYGSSRLGMDIETVELVDPILTTQDPIQRTLGLKQYELSNHLGNVLCVITDIKLPVVDEGVIVSYTAVVVSATDYSAFGVALYGRTWSSESYRYGFNGKEKDNEGMGGGNQTYDYGFRIYNPSLGKFLSVDPLAASYAWNSAYAFAENDVIRCIDLDGLEKLTMTVTSEPNTTTGEPGKAQLQIEKHYTVVTDGVLSVDKNVHSNINPEKFKALYSQGNTTLFMSSLPTSDADATYLSGRNLKLAKKALQGNDKAAKKLKDRGINYFVVQVEYNFTIDIEEGMMVFEGLDWMAADPAARGIVSSTFDSEETFIELMSEIEPSVSSIKKDFAQLNYIKAFRAFKEGGKSDDASAMGMIRSIYKFDFIFINQFNKTNFKSPVTSNEGLSLFSFTETEMIVHEAGHNCTDLGHKPGYMYSDTGLSSNINGRIYPTISNTKSIIRSANNRSNMQTIKK